MDAFALALIMAAATPGNVPAHDLVVEQATQAVCDKRVVLLGELPSHGEARGFQLKADIIRKLVKQCGFRTLVFEAPIYDFLLLSPRWGKGTVTPRQLDDAIGRFWSAKELGEWRGWLFAEAESGRLALRGMDDQTSATSMLAKELLPSMVAAKHPASEASRCAETVDRYLHWNYDDTHSLDEAEQQRLASCTRGLEGLALANFGGYVQRELELEDAPDRDFVMARNAGVHAQQDKILVWTASVHAAKQQGSRANKPAGTWMTERWGDQLAAIGFTALGGNSSMAGSPPKALEPAPPDSLEARLLGSKRDEVFADAKSLHELGAVQSRLLGKFQSADWSQFFDGVIVVREEKAPTFVPAVHEVNAGR